MSRGLLLPLVLPEGADETGMAVAVGAPAADEAGRALVVAVEVAAVTPSAWISSSRRIPGSWKMKLEIAAWS